jgi:hypothetical protein
VIRAAKVHPAQKETPVRQVRSVRSVLLAQKAIPVPADRKAIRAPKDRQVRLVRKA